MMASQTLLSRLNTHNYHNPLDGTLNRLANKLSITTSLCPSSRTLKAVDCGGKKTILVTKMKPSFGILQSTVNWLMPETFTPQSFLFTWHWNEDLRIHKIPTPEQQLKCIHRISIIQCYILCSIFSSIMLTNREQQEGNGVNGYHVKIHLVWMVFKWLKKQEQSARWTNQNSQQLPGTCSKRVKNAHTRTYHWFKFCFSFVEKPGKGF